MSGRDNYDFISTLGGGGGGGAPTTASYVVLALNGTLTAERVLTAGSGIGIVDGGAGGNVTISSSVVDGDKGDITVSSSGTVWSIDNDVVTNAQMATMTVNRIKGRITGLSGNPEDLTTAQVTSMLDLFSSGAKGLVPASGGGTTNFLRADGTFAAPPGGGGGANVGTATVDFGPFPGSSDATVAVTGQASIVAGSVVQAWLRPVATADHSADEHMLETIRVHASSIVPGTGFTINAFNAGTINEPDVDAVSRDGVSQQTGRPGGRGQQDVPASAKAGAKGTRLYGLWSVAWQWS
jgi:hypothetical protein